MSLAATGPLRADLLSVERLESKAEAIARDRVVEGKVADASLLGRVRDNGRVLLRCYRALAAVIQEERATTPAAEWLVDNFHIVEDVLNEVVTVGIRNAESAYPHRDVVEPIGIERLE